MAMPVPTQAIQPVRVLVDIDVIGESG